MKQPFTFTWKQIIYGLATIGVLFLLTGGLLFVIPKTRDSNIQWVTLVFGLGFVSLADGLRTEKRSLYRGRFLISGISLIFIGILFFVQSLPHSANSVRQLKGNSLTEKNNTSTAYNKDSVIQKDTGVRFIPAKELSHILNNH